MIAQMGNRNNAAARVVGRISLFLENLATDEELERLLSEDRRLKAVIEDIEGRLGADDSESRLVATSATSPCTCRDTLKASTASLMNSRRGLTFII